LDTKFELRQQMKALRNGLDPDIRQQLSNRICQRITDFCLSRRIHRIGAFWPYGSEVDLRPLVQAHPDWTFFFPRISSTHPPRLIWGPEPLEAGMFGLQEPIHAQHFLPPVQLLLLPGLAFDSEGYRLGYGMGFYDAVLERLSEDVIAMAVGFSCQRCAELPRDPQDLPVQVLMTEQGVESFSSAS